MDHYELYIDGIEGETVPSPILQQMFPVSKFANKRIIIHRDRPFRGDEVSCLTAWGEKINATFYFVEITKRNSPRLYLSDGKNISHPERGTFMKLSKTHAILMSNPPIFGNCTPRPLQIKHSENISQVNAIDSVLKLTCLHYGSIRAPRIPVTLHYSDKIAYLASKGIRPRDLSGTTPFWL